MKRAFLFMGLILILLCSPGNSAISSFYSTNKLNATLSGGENLKSVNGLIQAPYYHANQLTVDYGAGLAAVDVKDISMNSTAFLVVTDQNGQNYPTILTTTNDLHLPVESDVIIENGCNIGVNSNSPGSPKVGWRSALEFPDDLNLTAVNLNSTLDDLPVQDLEKLNTYCIDHGIGYTTGSNAYFTDSNPGLGITCRWGEGEKIAVGSGSE